MPNSGEDGLKLLQADADRFNVVLTDYSMPDMDGRTMVQRARELGEMPPFIIISGYALGEDDLQGDFVATLLKPFRLRDIETLLESLCPSRE